MRILIGLVIGFIIGYWIANQSWFSKVKDATGFGSGRMAGNILPDKVCLPMTAECKPGLEIWFNKAKYVFDFANQATNQCCFKLKPSSQQ